MKKTILLTGCSSGFGKLTAKLFHKKVGAKACIMN